jgi:hypothetical protein
LPQEPSVSRATTSVNRPCTYARLSEGRPRATPLVHESSPAEPAKPRLLDRVRAALRSRHYSRRTEEAYVLWTRRYIVFHGKRHPLERDAAEITRFLTALAVDDHVAASTQNQALSGLLFLYREVLEVDVPWLDGLVRAKRPERLPVVLTRDEVRAVIQRLDGMPRLMAKPGSVTRRCCEYLTDNPIRAFRNAIAHSNWTYAPGFSGLVYWARKGSNPDEALSRFEVGQRELDFWQTLSRGVAYAAYTSIESVEGRRPPSS